jgi:hypothetical protein
MLDVENPTAHCGLAGFQNECKIEICLPGLLIAELVNRDATRGADRAKDLIENIV